MINRTPIVCDRCRRAGVAGEGDFLAMKPLLDFAPVPRKYRHDGWTPERQRAFIGALADTGAVSLAAKAVNMSPEGAYYLRRQPGAEAFREAWEAALDRGAELVDGNALERSIHGVAVPIFHDGRQVGERRVYDERLTMFLLRHRKPEIYGDGTGGGTKAADTLAREKARAEAAGREDALVAAVQALGAQYYRVVACERLARADGREDDADFYLRQLTHIEFLLQCGGRAWSVLKPAWKAEMNDWPPKPKPPPDPVMTDYVDRLRAAAWARLEGEEAWPYGAEVDPLAEEAEDAPPAALPAPEGTVTRNCPHFPKETGS